MKYSTLSDIVVKEALRLKESAGYSGSHTDGGSASLLQKLSNYKNSLVVKYDLKPSEFNQLNDKDIGEPNDFSNIIRKHKMELAEDIVNNMKL